MPLERRKQVEAALRRGRTTLQRMQASYFDTVDGVLAQHRISLRVRKEGRRSRGVRHEGATVEIALDQGKVLAGGQALELNELELELKHGRPQGAVALAQRWCRQQGLWLSTVSKAMQGQQLAAGQPWGPAVHAKAPKFDEHATGHEIAVAVVTACLDQVLANASQAAAGSTDAEAVHQLRVGIRRLRTALRELGALVGYARSAAGETGPDAAGARKIIRKRLKKLRSRAKQDGRNFLSLAEDDQHGLRKRLKRLRYLADFVAPLFPARKVRAFLDGLKPGQDALGSYNDELMALKAFEQRAGRDPRALFGAGWLSARRQSNAIACAQTLEAFAQVKPFWD